MIHAALGENDEAAGSAKQLTLANCSRTSFEPEFATRAAMSGLLLRNLS